MTVAQDNFLQQKDLHEQHYYESLINLPQNTGLDFTSKMMYIRKKDSREYYSKSINCFTTSMLERHLKGTSTYALPRFKQSNIRIIDIDQSSNPKIKTIDVVRKIVQVVGIPYFIEYSSQSNGYHLYFKYDGYVSNAQWKALPIYIKSKFGLVIETTHSERGMCLPFSKYYTIAGSYDPNSPHLIFNHSTLQEKLDSFNNSGEPIRVPKVFDIIVDPPIQVAFTKETLQKIRDKSLKQKSFNYGRGTRYFTQFAIGFHLLRFDENASFLQYMNVCEKWNDGTSRDMAKESDVVLRFLEKQWEWIQTHFKAPKSKNQIEGFEPQASFDTDELYSELIYDKHNFDGDKQEYLRKVLEIGYCRHTIGKIGGKFQKRFIDGSMIAIDFMQSCEEYRKNRGYKYVNENFTPLENGVPFGKKLQRTLAHFFHIKNINKIIQFLIDMKFIRLLYDTDGYAYSYKKERYVKHYELEFNNIYSIYLSILENPNSQIPKLKILFLNINNVYNYYHKIYIIYKNSRYKKNVESLE